MNLVVATIRTFVREQFRLGHEILVREVADGKSDASKCNTLELYQVHRLALHPFTHKRGTWSCWEFGEVVSHVFLVASADDLFHAWL